MRRLTLIWVVFSGIGPILFGQGWLPDHFMYRNHVFTLDDLPYIPFEHRPDSLIIEIAEPFSLGEASLLRDTVLCTWFEFGAPYLLKSESFRYGDGFLEFSYEYDRSHNFLGGQTYYIDDFSRDLFGNLEIRKSYLGDMVLAGHRLLSGDWVRLDSCAIEYDIESRIVKLDRYLFEDGIALPNEGSIQDIAYDDEGRVVGLKWILELEDEEMDTLSFTNLRFLNGRDTPFLGRYKTQVFSAMKGYPFIPFVMYKFGEDFQSEPIAYELRRAGILDAYRRRFFVHDTVEQKICVYEEVILNEVDTVPVELPYCMKFDRNGRLRELRFYGDRNLDETIHSVEFQYDQWGYLSKERFESGTDSTVLTYELVVDEFNVLQQFNYREQSSEESPLLLDSLKIYFKYASGVGMVATDGSQASLELTPQPSVGNQWCVQYKDLPKGQLIVLDLQGKPVMAARIEQSDGNQCFQHNLPGGVYVLYFKPTEQMSNFRLVRRLFVKD